MEHAIVDAYHDCLVTGDVRTFVTENYAPDSELVTWASTAVGHGAITFVLEDFLRRFGPFEPVELSQETSAPGVRWVQTLASSDKGALSINNVFIVDETSGRIRIHLAEAPGYWGSTV